MALNPQKGQSIRKNVEKLNAQSIDDLANNATLLKDGSETSEGTNLDLFSWKPFRLAQWYNALKLLSLIALSYFKQRVA